MDTYKTSISDPPQKKVDPNGRGTRAQKDFMISTAKMGVETVGSKPSLTDYYSDDEIIHIDG